MDELIEKIAILMAEGNNGGEWASHYTVAQKTFWRSRAAEVILAVLKATLDSHLEKLSANLEKMGDILSGKAVA